MDLANLLKLMVGRWYLTVPLVLITIVAAMSTASSVGPSYQVSGDILLLAPIRGGTVAAPGESAPPPGNPYLRFDKNLEVVGDLLATVMTSNRMVEKMREQGASAEYDIGFSTMVQSPSSAGSPLLKITATDPDPATAQHTVATVSHYLSNELARRQKAACAPDETMIRTQSTTPPTVTGRLIGSAARVAAATAVLGLALSLGLLLLFEAVHERRERKRRIQRRAAAATRGRTARAARQAVGPAAAAVVPPARPAPARVPEQQRL